MANKRKPMDIRSSPAEEVRSTMVVEYMSMMTGTKEQLQEAHSAFEELANGFFDRCKDLGVQLHGTGGVTRPLTKEESIQLVPRKWHLERSGLQACDTAFVSKSYLTDDVGRVTCKLCLKKLREENERLEAASGNAEGREERPLS